MQNVSRASPRLRTPYIFTYKERSSMKLRLREMRESSRLLQRQIAVQLHCTQQTYSRYENGELQPSLRIMESLAEFYSTSVDFLLGLTDEQIPHKRSQKRHSDI